MVLGLLAAGCRHQGSSSAPGETDDLTRYGYLPGLKAAADTRLQDELARLVEEQATPEQLDAESVPDEQNVAAGLRPLFEQRRVAGLLEESARYLPTGDFAFAPGVKEPARAFCRRYESQRLKAREVLNRPRCSFGIRFLRGNFDPLSFVDTVEICARLEQLHGADMLERGRPVEAVDALSTILRMAQCLGAEKHVVPRLKAAYLRSDAFALLQAIVLRGNSTPEQIDRLYGLVDAQLKAWPADADAWIGDRALGLHAYELVRDGHLLALLTDYEIDELRKEGDLVAMAERARQTADADELYYLQTMRKIIDSCAQPFYARQELFNNIDHDLARRQGSADYPLVAGKLLLPGMRKAQQVQARDRANWEALALALAAAAQRELPDFQVNPATGKPYRVVREEGVVVVSNVGSTPEDDTPVRVPLPTQSP